MGIFLLFWNVLIDIILTEQYQSAQALNLETYNYMYSFTFVHSTNKTQA